MVFFKPYEVIMNLTWFSRRSFGVCAQHYYDFDTALVRPSNSFIAFNKSMINPYFPLEKYSVSKLSTGNMFGAIQIKVNFTSIYLLIVMCNYFFINILNQIV
jgi:hypothetical protein